MKKDSESFDRYQRAIVKYDTSDPKVEIIPVGLLEKILGLTGEAGETADKFKKILRDNNGKISKSDREEIVKELGDVLWYTATIARYMGVSFSEVAKKNLEKAESRFKRGKLHGSGDNR